MLQMQSTGAQSKLVQSSLDLQDSGSVRTGLRGLRIRVACLEVRTVGSVGRKGGDDGEQRPHMCGFWLVQPKAVTRW